MTEDFNQFNEKAFFARSVFSIYCSISATVSIVDALSPPLKLAKEQILLDLTKKPYVWFDGTAQGMWLK